MCHNPVDDVLHDLGISDDIADAQKLVGLGAAVNGLANLISSVADQATNLVNAVVSPVIQYLGTVASNAAAGVNEVFNAAAGVFNTSLQYANDLGTLAAQTLNGIVSDVGNALQAIDQTVSQAANNLYSSVQHDITTAENNIKDFGSDASVFLKKYGHTIVDIVANSFFPGSSVLVDAVWAEANGQPISLENLGKTAVDSLAAEYMPGLDEVIGDVLPDVAADIVSGALDTTVTSELNNGTLPTTQELINGSLQTVIANEDPTLFEDIENDVASKLNLSDYLPALEDGLNFVQSAQNTYNEVVADADALSHLNQAEILGLAAAGVTTIDEFDGVAIHVNDALALEASGMSIVGPAVQLLDEANDIASFTQSQLEELKAIGVDTITATDNQVLALSWQEADALIGSGIEIASDEAPVYLVASAVDVAQNLSDSFVQQLSEAGIDVITSVGAVTISAQLAADMDWFDTQLKVYNDLGVTISDSAQDIQNLTAEDIRDFKNQLSTAKVIVSGSLTLDLEQAEAFIYDAIPITLASGAMSLISSAASLQGLTVSQINSLKSFGVSAATATGELTVGIAQASALGGVSVEEILSNGTTALGFDVEDTAADYLSMSLNGVSNRFGVNLSVIDTASDLLGLTSSQVTSLKSLFLSSIAVTDNITDLLSLSTSNILYLKTLGNVGWSVSDNLANVLNYLGGNTTSLSVPISSWNVTINSFENDPNLLANQLSSSAIDKLSQAGVKSLNFENGNYYSSIDNGVYRYGIYLNVSQVQALIRDGVKIETSDPYLSPVIAEIDSPIDLETMSPDQITAMGAAGITQIYSPRSVALSPAQAAALRSAGLSLVGGAGALSTVSVPVTSLTGNADATAQSLHTIPIRIGRPTRLGGDISTQINDPTLAAYASIGLTHTGTADLTINSQPQTGMVISGSGSGSISVVSYRGTDASGNSIFGGGPTVTAVNNSWSIDLSPLGNGPVKLEVDEYNNGVLNATAVVSTWNINQSDVADFNGDGQSDVFQQNLATGQISVGPVGGSQTVAATVPTAWAVAGSGDFNGDGDADFVWQNASTGQVAIWAMNGSTPIDQAIVGSVPLGWNIAGVSDFNGDGKSDLLWRNDRTGQVAIWEMDGATPTAQSAFASVPLSWRIAGVGQFNGRDDADADILWQNTSTGEVALWEMDGANPISEQIFATVPTSWEVEGVGDFDGDGQADILWVNKSTSQVAIWEMYGPTPTTQTIIGSIGDEYKLAEIGDFNGDGKSDVLWQNTVTGTEQLWAMNGSSIQSNSTVATLSGPWQVGGNTTPKSHNVSYDFSGAGSADLLWRNSSTGEVAIWQLDGATPVAQTVFATVPTNWSVVGAGDFNADGLSDILWQDGSTGQIAIWNMDGSNPLAQNIIGSAPSGWGVAGVGDFDGTGTADILWRNKSNGQVALWEMNGDTAIAQTVIATVPSDWAIVGTGTFYGPGDDSILWQNSANGQVAIWQMNGSTPVTQTIIGAASTGWQVEGTGDFNGDGNDDILWQNANSGQVAIWEMNGATPIKESVIGTASSGWNVAEVGHTSGNSDSDILWQNYNTGQIALWEMNGVVPVSQSIIATVPTTWTVAHSVLAAGH